MLTSRQASRIYVGGKVGGIARREGTRVSALTQHGRRRQVYTPGEEVLIRKTATTNRVGGGDGREGWIRRDSEKN